MTMLPVAKVLEQLVRDVQASGLHILLTGT